MAIPNVEMLTAIQKRPYEASYITATNWCIILPTSFDACHRPVAMQVQSHQRTQCLAMSQMLVNDIENQDVRYAFCAQARAYVDQGCRGGPSAAAHRATFNKLNGILAISQQSYNPSAS